MRARGAPADNNSKSAVDEAAPAGQGKSGKEDEEQNGSITTKFLGTLLATLVILCLIQDHGPATAVDTSARNGVQRTPMLRQQQQQLQQQSAQVIPAEIHLSTTGRYHETTSAYLLEYDRPDPIPRSNPVSEVRGGNADHKGRMAACPSPHGTFGKKIGHCVAERQHNPVQLCESEPTCTHVVWNVEGTFATLFISHDWTPVPEVLQQGHGASVGSYPSWWQLKTCMDTAAAPPSKSNQAVWAAKSCYDYNDGPILPTLTADPPLVFDVGLSNGRDTAWYLKRGARVISVEAR